MGNFYLYLKLFLLGFCTALMINLNLSCSEKESITKPKSEAPDFSEYQETESMKKLSEDLIAALKSNKKEDVIEFLSDEVKEIYSNILKSSTKSLSDYGIALESRKLIFANELFAEYEIIIEGETYSIDYGNGGDGVWKLLRL